MGWRDGALRRAGQFEEALKVCGERFSFERAYGLYKTDKVWPQPRPAAPDGCASRRRGRAQLAAARHATKATAARSASSTRRIGSDAGTVRSVSRTSRP